jgi:acetoin utilization deacetylase AcuC-like enzyme
MGLLDVYYDPMFLRHETGEHVESRQRLIAATEALTNSDVDFDWITPQPAELQAIARIHDMSYIQTVREIAEEGGGWLDWDTAISPDSYEAALLAAGAGIMAAEKAVTDARRAFLLVRPPGHHARRSKGMGFCLFNNIAVAASYALDELKLERVLIVDWDVHHGNGTNESFYDDSRVLFFSVHESNHYPGTGEVADVGSGEGAGYSINVPLTAGCGDGALLEAFESLLLPVARAYRPQLVLVSAGYDGQRGDPLGDLNYSESAYQWMAARLSSFCEQSGAAGPVVFLEGGYVPNMMASSVIATLRGMAAEEPDFAPEASVAERRDVERAVTALRPYWEQIL